MELCRQESRKARKEHICDWCGGTINKGEEYDYAAIKNEGEFYTWKNHKRCHELANKLDMWDRGYEETVSQEDFYEYILLYLEEKLSKKEYSLLDKGDVKKLTDLACKMIGIG